MTAHNTRRASLCQSFPSECMGGRVRGRGFACVSVRTVWGREGSTAGLLLALRSPQWTGTATPVPLGIFRGYTSFTQRHRLPKQLRHLQSFESHPSTEEYNVPSISSALGLFPKSTNSGTHFSPTVGVLAAGSSIYAPFLSVEPCSGKEGPRRLEMNPEIMRKTSQQ